MYVLKISFRKGNHSEKFDNPIESCHFPSLLTLPTTLPRKL